jgi:hypothetical protein
VTCGESAFNPIEGAFRFFWLGNPAASWLGLRRGCPVKIARHFNIVIPDGRAAWTPDKRLRRFPR